MSSTSTLKFNDLNLRFGEVVQIHADPSSPVRSDCVLVGCLPGEAIIVTTTESGEFPFIEEGQQVAIRVMSANGVALFPTTVLCVTDMPVFMVFLDFPKAIKFKLVRSAARVDVALPVLSSNLSRAGFRGVPGKVTDISTSGARVEMTEQMGDIGDKVQLKGKFEVGDISRMVTIEAVIRSQSPAGNGRVAYGLEFYEGDEDKLIVLFGFIFSSIAFGRVQTVR